MGFIRLSDANRLVLSDIYRTIVWNKRLEDRRQGGYIGTRVENKADNICYEEYGYVYFVKNKYESFCESLDGLNYSLSNLYLGRMLGLDDRLGM